MFKNQNSKGKNGDEHARRVTPNIIMYNYVPIRSREYSRALLPVRAVLPGRPRRNSINSKAVNTLCLVEKKNVRRSACEQAGAGGDVCSTYDSSASAYYKTISSRLAGRSIGPTRNSVTI